MTDSSAYTPPNSRKKIVVVIVAVAIVGAAVAGYRWSRGARTDGTLRISGNIEVDDAEVSFRVPGRIAERLVSEGESVEQDQVIARLDAAELEQLAALSAADAAATQAALAEVQAGSRAEEIAQADAAARQAEAQLSEVMSGSRPQEIAAAEASLAAARADATRATTEMERFRMLRGEGVISAQQFDAAKTAADAAQARARAAEEQMKLVREGPRKEQVEQAREAARQARERAAMVKAGPRKETIAQVRARAQQAQESAKVATTRLGYAELRAPISGVVLSENVEAGEFVAAGTPVVTIGDLSNVWLRGYIPETDLGLVKLGQAVDVTTDTFPGKVYRGKISFISSQAEFTPKTVETAKERVKLVYRVKIDIPNPAQELKPGMPADAEIRSGG
jgi:HlyD family secretion protein